jgi:hypothetical protein
MTSTTFLPYAREGRYRSEGEELLSDYRQRRALEETQRAEQRRDECAQQSSMLNSADLRIRAWEKVHNLRMPSDPSHPVLAAITVATQLTLDEVQTEQRLRAARRAAARV